MLLRTTGGGVLLGMTGGGGRQNHMDILSFRVPLTVISSASYCHSERPLLSFRAERGIYGMPLRAVYFVTNRRVGEHFGSFPVQRIFWISLPNPPMESQ